MIADLDLWLQDLESELSFGVSVANSNLPSQPTKGAESSAGTNDDKNLSMEIRTRDETSANSDNDEAEPSSMVDSALSGGSTKTSAPLLSLNCRSTSPLEETPSSSFQSSADDESIPAFDFDNWLNSLDDLEFAEEESYDSLVDSVEEYSTTGRSSLAGGTGRKSAEDGKHFAFNTPIMEALNDIYQPCNNLCHLTGFCTKPISGNSILDLRNKYFRDAGKDAPKDKERGQLIMEYIRNAKKDDDNNLTFVVDNHNVCTSAFLRLLGATSSADMTKAPGQWTRLIKGFINKSSDDTLLSKDSIKLDSEQEFTMKRGHVKAYCNEVAQYFCDYLPTVSSDDGSTNALQVPYGTIKSFFAEYEFHCNAIGIPREARASYQTFVRAFNELRKDGIVILLGGKSGMNTCALCNNVTAIKRSACCKRDTITRDALLKLSRLHLSQQATERQHAENFIKLAKNIDMDGQPTRGYFDIDGQSVWAGNTPRLSKDRQTKLDTHIENRNVGVRIVCGPVDEYICLCTNNLIPHGANVLVEIVRYSIEYLARRLADFDMVLPKMVGLQFDNSGENKNKELFCFLSHLLEDCYFNEIEVFFLIVGHTHNILDQWFSVLAKAIKGADFVGSVLALHALYRLAHSEEEADKRPQHIHQLQTYHDWRRFYNPVRNDQIHNYGLPHRFKLTLDEFLKVAKMEYMMMSPQQGFKHIEKWQPSVMNKKSLVTNGSIPLAPLGIFDGPATVLQALGLKRSNLDDVAAGTKKDLEKLNEFNEILPLLRELEVRCIGEARVRMEQEADSGQSAETIHLTAAQLKKIDNEITYGNANQETARIVWLRRSKIDDPNYLKGRPEVLPNLKAWRERIANAPKPPNPEERRPIPTKEEEEKAKKDTADAKEAQLRLVQFQNGAAEMATTANYMLSLVDDECAISIASTNDIVTATNAFKKAVLTNREVAWYRGISSAKLISAKIEALAEAAEKTPWRLLNLPEETPEQRKRRDEQKRANERRAVEVEKALRKLVVRDGEGIYNPDMQVISMDGFTAAKTQDVEKMTKPQLAAIAKAAVAKGYFSKAEIKDLKVKELRAKIVDYVKQHPEAIQIPGAPPTSSSALTNEPAADPDMETTIPEAGTEEDNVDHPQLSCSVLECEANGTVRCGQCDLVFCSELHGPHSSHDFQMLRSDRQRRRIIDDRLEQEELPSSTGSSADALATGEVVCEEGPSEELPSSSSVDALATGEVVCGEGPSHSGNEDSINATTLSLEESSSALFISACDGIKIFERCRGHLESVAKGPSKRDATAAALENTAASKMLTPMPSTAVDILVPPIVSAVESSQPNPLLTSSILPRSEYDNVESRKRWEIEKFGKVVTFVREQLLSGRTDLDRILFEYLKYPACYDISFLQALAVEFEVDISEIVRKKRASHKEVVNDLVNKLVKK